MYKVSVIVPTYNSAHYLPDCMDSLLSQTFKDFEVIVIDDASTDNTERVISKYTNSFSNRLKYIKLDNNVGRGEVRNYGIIEAQGEYIAFLDADDVYLPDKLKVQSKYLDEHTMVEGVSCQYYNGNEVLEPQSLSKGLPSYFQSIFGSQFSNLEVGTVGIMLRRRVIEKVGMFDSKITRGQDTDLIIRIWRHYRIDFISKPLFIYRRHENNTGSFTALMERTVSNLRICKKIIDSEPISRKATAKKFAFDHLSSHIYQIRERKHITAIKVWFFYLRKMKCNLPLVAWSILGIKVMVGYRLTKAIKRMTGLAARECHPFDVTG